MTSVPPSQPNSSSSSSSSSQSAVVHMSAADAERVAHYTIAAGGRAVLKPRRRRGVALCGSAQDATSPASGRALLLMLRQVIEGFQLASYALQMPVWGAALTAATPALTVFRLNVTGPAFIAVCVALLAIAAVAALSGLLQLRAHRRAAAAATPLPQRDPTTTSTATPANATPAKANVGVLQIIANVCFWLSGTVLFVPTLSALSGVLLCRTDSFGDSIDACWASPAHTVLLIVAVLVVVALCVVLATSAGKSVLSSFEVTSHLAQGHRLGDAEEQPSSIIGAGDARAQASSGTIYVPAWLGYRILVVALAELGSATGNTGMGVTSAAVFLGALAMAALLFIKPGVMAMPHVARFGAALRAATAFVYLCAMLASVSVIAVVPGLQVAASYALLAYPVAVIAAVVILICYMPDEMRSPVEEATITARANTGPAHLWDCHTPNLKLQVRPTPREDVVAVGPASEEHPSTTSSSTAPSSDTAIRSSTSVDQDSDGAGHGAGAGAGMGAGAAADTADADSGAAAAAAQVSTATPRQHRARRTPGELSEPNHQFDNTANTVTFHRQREQFWRELAQETHTPTLPLSANVGANVAARPANSPEQSMRRVSSALANGGQPAAFPSSQVAEPGSHVEAPELSLYAIGNRRPVDVRALVRGDSGLRALSKIVGSGCVGNDMVFGMEVAVRQPHARSTRSARGGSGASASEPDVDPRLRGFHPGENDAAMITTDGVSMLASLLSQHSSAAYTARCVRISGVYLTYESMTTLIYRILRMPCIHRLDLADNVFDETSAVNAVYMLRNHETLVELQLGQSAFSQATIDSIQQILNRDGGEEGGGELGDAPQQLAASTRGPAPAAASIQTQDYVTYELTNLPVTSQASASRTSEGIPAKEDATRAGAATQPPSADATTAATAVASVDASGATEEAVPRPAVPTPRTAAAPPMLQSAAAAPSQSYVMTRSGQSFVIKTRTPAELLRMRQAAGNMPQHRATAHAGMRGHIATPNSSSSAEARAALAVAVHGGGGSAAAARRHMSAPVRRRTTMRSNRMRSSVVNGLQSRLCDTFSNGGQVENNGTYHRTSYVEMDEEVDLEGGSDADDVLEAEGVELEAQHNQAGAAASASGSALPSVASTGTAASGATRSRLSVLFSAPSGSLVPRASRSAAHSPFSAPQHITAMSTLSTQPDETAVSGSSVHRHSTAYSAAYTDGDVSPMVATGRVTAPAEKEEEGTVSVVVDAGEAEA